jgi:hypothetical protein
MQALSKTMVLFLLAAVITAPLAAQELRTDASSHARPAGCHEDDGNVPAPAPASHSCCLGAHHPAILQQSSSLRASFQGSVGVDVVPHSVTVAVPSRFLNLVIVPGDPPILSPLRV